LNDNVTINRYRNPDFWHYRIKKILMNLFPESIKQAMEVGIVETNDRVQRLILS
jgi:hypothetical protein